MGEGLNHEPKFSLKRDREIGSQGVNEREIALVEGEAMTKCSCLEGASGGGSSVELWQAAGLPFGRGRIARRGAWII